MSPSDSILGQIHGSCGHYTHMGCCCLLNSVGLVVNLLTCCAALSVSLNAHYVGYKENIYSIVRHMVALSEHGIRLTYRVFPYYSSQFPECSLPSCRLANLLSGSHIAVGRLVPYSILSNSIPCFPWCALLYFPTPSFDHGGTTLILSWCHISLHSVCIGPSHHKCIASCVDRQRSSCSCICLSPTYRDWTISLVVPCTA